MSRRGKRGVSKGSRHFEGAVYKIEFRKKLPCGENKSRFMSDFNRLCEKHLNYWEEWKIVKGEPYDRVWLKIKVLYCVPIHILYIISIYIRIISSYTSFVYH